MGTNIAQIIVKITCKTKEVRVTLILTNNKRFYGKEVFTIQYFLQKQRQLLSAQLSSLKEKVDELPAGTLIYSRSPNHTKWYISNGSKPIYIPKREHSTAEQLAVRKFYEYQIEEITYQLKLLDQFLEKLQHHPTKSTELLKESSYYHELLQKSFSVNQFNPSQWENQIYQHNPNHQENLIHNCHAGHLVRSKSEVIIANALYINKIPYRYECQLILNDITLYPDFTILHPKTHKIYYWEHFGLMSNSSYRENTFNKLKLYGNHGIIPSIQLLTTYETNEVPINSEQVQRMIETYFL